MLAVFGGVDGRCDMRSYSSSNSVHSVAVCVVVYKLHMGCIRSINSVHITYSVNTLWLLSRLPFDSRWNVLILIFLILSSQPVFLNRSHKKCDP